MRQALLTQAESVADRVDIMQAIPFTLPRAVYSAGLAVPFRTMARRRDDAGPLDPIPSGRADG